MEYLKNDRIDIPSVGEWVGRFMRAVLPPNLACVISGSVTSPEDVGANSWFVKPQWLRDAMGYDKPVEGRIFVTTSPRLEDVFAQTLIEHGEEGEGQKYRVICLEFAFTFSKQGVAVALTARLRERSTSSQHNPLATVDFRYRNEVCHFVSVVKVERSAMCSPESAAKSMGLSIFSAFKVKTFPKGSEVYEASKCQHPEGVLTLLVDE